MGADGREPTSHERRSGAPWDASYQAGPAPWDIGRPQPAIAKLASEGGFAGAVLDAGCGTGENALLIAGLGVPVLGVDVAETAVAIAREKASERRSDAEFAVADALRLDRLGRAFDTVLDCGLFHTFDGDDRRRYVASLASVTKPGAALHVLCFSDADADTSGPHPVSRDELCAAFDRGAGWHVAAIVPTRIETRYHDGGAPAWLASIERVAASLRVEESSLDHPDAARLLDAFSAEIAALYPGWSPATGPSATPRDFAPPAGAFLVAYRAGRAVGCGGLKPLDCRHAEVKRLYVAPESRGAGVARRLLDALEAAARERGHDVVRLDTGNRQPAALALFRSAGYEPIPDYNGNPAASHWLEKRLR